MCGKAGEGFSPDGTISFVVRAMLTLIIFAHQPGVACEHLVTSCKLTTSDRCNDPEAVFPLFLKKTTATKKKNSPLETIVPLK